MNLYCGETAIQNGDRYIYKDNKTARLWYLTALEDELTRNIALRKLLELERKIGNYKMAREYANMLYELKDSQANYFLGKIEHIEYNFLSALDYYSKDLSSKSLPVTFQQTNLKFIANIYTQLGEFEIARRIYETFLYNLSSNIGLLELINLDIIQGDYTHGLNLLKKVESKNQSDIDTLRDYYLILMYKLGRINEVNKDKFKNSYTYKRMISSDDSILLKHLKGHCKDGNLYEIVFNSKETINMILNSIPDLIKKLNPIYSTGSKIYRLNLDYNIGKYNGDLVSGLGIVTINNKVFTMYPLNLSSSFDREEMTHSEELNKKRTMGVRK